MYIILFIRSRMIFVLFECKKHLVQCTNDAYGFPKFYRNAIKKRLLQTNLSEIQDLQRWWIKMKLKKITSVGRVNSEITMLALTGWSLCKQSFVYYLAVSCYLCRCWDFYHQSVIFCVSTNLNWIWDGI